jgi:hypothetical protein
VARFEDRVEDLLNNISVLQFFSAFHISEGVSFQILRVIHSRIAVKCTTVASTAANILAEHLSPNVDFLLSQVDPSNRTKRYRTQSSTTNQAEESCLCEVHVRT